MSRGANKIRDKRPKGLTFWTRLLAAAASVGVLALSLFGAIFIHYTDNLMDNVTAIDISDIPAPMPTPTPSKTEAPGGDTTPSSAPAAKEEDNSINILLMGSDSRQDDNAQYGDPSVHSSERSDTTILLHISGDRKWASAISFPRDTWTTLPECETPWGEVQGGYEGKFNSAFQYGGPRCTIRLVQNITGIKIDHFAVVDFSGFKDIVNALGGVQLCLPSDVADYSSGLMLPAGKNLLDGEQALAFVRARKQLSDGSDIARIGRQQQFLHAIANQVLNSGLLTDPGRLYDFLDATTKSLTVDSELKDLKNLASLAAEVAAVPSNKLTFSTVPWYSRGDGENVVIDETQASTIWEALKSDTKLSTEKRAAIDGGKDEESKQLICP